MFDGRQDWELDADELADRRSARRRRQESLEQVMNCNRTSEKLEEKKALLAAFVFWVLMVVFFAGFVIATNRASFYQNMSESFKIRFRAAAEELENARQEIQKMKEMADSYAEKWRKISAQEY